MRGAGVARIRHPQPLLAPSPAWDAGDPGRYAPAVGRAAHRVIGELAARRDLTAAELVELAWERAADAVAEAELGRRSRAARLTVAGAAAVYLRRFLPPPGWQFLGAELRFESGARADLGWEADRVLLDELKLVSARGVPLGEGPTARQAAAYAEAGRARYGARFAGVRLLFLGAPGRSRLVLPGGRELPLADTAYEFGTPPVPEVM